MYLPVLSILLSAFLLFGIQPFAARLLLPGFGGSPAVWNTCLVFFQCVLLLGYLYAHGLTRLGRRAQLFVHGLVLALPLALLPPHLAWVGAPPARAWPVPSLLLTLFLLVGPVFFTLSTNSTLVQWWCARRGHRDPYFLYAASNTGSLVALLAYPLLLEPLFGLQVQARGLALGYVVFALLSAVLLRRAHHTELAPAADAAPKEAAPKRLRRWGWVLRSAVGSSLLLGVSLQVTTDMAANPLLWVVPLALYLLTFIVAFSVPRLPRRALVMAIVVTVVLALARELMVISEPSWLVLALPLLALTLGCLLLHGDLAADRPAPEHLTSFYLWISLGGFLGGLVVNLVGPMIFDRVVEVPLALLVLAILLRPTPDWKRWRKDLRSPVAVAYLLFTTAWATALYLGWSKVGDNDVAVVQLALCIPLALGALVRHRVGLFEVGVATALAVLWIGAPVGGRIIAVERSFFGVSRVVQDGDERRLMHGTTLHGSELMAGPQRGCASTYYQPATPMGRAMAVQASDAHIGVVGLGAGSLAALSKEGQHMVYYEIDPLVERLAREHFTFLNEAAGEVEVRHGDARIVLQSEAPNDYDLLILDAFSSDAVPMHLLSREALRLYLSHLSSQGVLLAHISNRHLDLQRVFRGHGEALDLTIRACFYEPTEEESARGAQASEVLALARSPQALADLPEDWEALPAGEVVNWTDDSAALWPVMR